MAFVHHQGTREYAIRNMWPFFVCLILVLVTIITLSCCEGVRRTSPSNMIFLSLFTIGESILVGYCTISYPPDTVNSFFSFNRKYVYNLLIVSVYNFR